MFILCVYTERFKENIEESFKITVETTISSSREIGINTQFGKY